MEALTYVLCISHYGVESWTITISDTHRIRSFEMWYGRRILGVLWKDHRTALLELKLKRNLIERVAQLKLYFGHVASESAGELALMVMEGATKGTRPKGAPKKQWLNNIQELRGKNLRTMQDAGTRSEQWKNVVLKVVTISRGTSSEKRTLRNIYIYVICISQQIHNDANIIATNIQTICTINQITNIETKEKRCQHAAMPYTISDPEKPGRTILPANNTVPITKQQSSNQAGYARIGFN